MNINVLNIVLNNFSNDSRVLKISKTLGEEGFNVKVVALHDNKLPEREKKFGFDVHRVNLISNMLPKMAFFRIIKYFEFLVLVALKYRKYDILHCNDLSALPIGIIIKLFNSKSKIVYDCHEFQSETNNLSWLNKLMIKLLEKYLIRYVDCVITVSESIAMEYSRIYNIKKPYVILNCPSKIHQEKKDIFREKFSIREDQLIYIFQGNLGEGRGIDNILDVFSEFLDDKLVVVFMGYGSFVSKIKEKAKQSKNIYYHPAVSYEEILDYSSSADFGISYIEDTCLSYRYCLPNKMFEYLMAGLPVITSNLIEMKRVVESESIGVVASENNLEGLRNAVLNSIGLDRVIVSLNIKNAQKIYCWESQGDILKSIYNNLI